MTFTSLDSGQLRLVSFVPEPPVQVPAKVDLRAKFPPVYDQGAFPADISGAMCSVFQYMDPGGFAGSRLFVDYVAQSLMAMQASAAQKTYLTDTQVLYSIKALENVGMPSEVDWPYHATSAASMPPDSCYQSASGHKLLRTINIDIVGPAYTQLKACLLTNVPWLVAMTIYSGWFNDPAVVGKTDSLTGVFTKGTGVISQTYQTSASDADLGNITVCIVGFDDSSKYWIARTCLGTHFGDNGHLYLPYSYLAAHTASIVWAFLAVSNSATKISTKPTWIPCQMSDWTAGLLCAPPTPAPALACGWSGTKTDTRTVITDPSGGAPACPTSLTRTSACSAPACPVDCSVGDWSAYSQCDAKVCGTAGSQTRARTIVTDAQNNGARCPALAQTQSCNAPACAVDCLVGEWSEWSKCSSTSCGTSGTQTVTRAVTRAPAGAGQKCPALTSTTPCDPPCSTEITVTVVVFSAVMFLLLAAVGAMTLL